MPSIGGPRVRVLVVEGHAATLYATERALRHHGFATECAATAAGPSRRTWAGCSRS